MVRVTFPDVVGVEATAELDVPLPDGVEGC